MCILCKQGLVHMLEILIFSDFMLGLIWSEILQVELRVTQYIYSNGICLAKHYNE